MPVTRLRLGISAQAGGSCQEMGPPSTLRSTFAAPPTARRDPAKLAGPQRPFLPPTGGALQHLPGRPRPRFTRDSIESQQCPSIGGASRRLISLAGGQVAAVEDLAKLAREGLGLAGVPELAAEEAAVMAREHDRLPTEELGGGHRGPSGERAP
jgi:hypothetical protein